MADKNKDTKRICVIGGGPSGLAALKAILDTPQFKDGLWTPVLFEAREDVGGVWLPAPPVDNPPKTPMYDSLTTNVPHPLMAYTSYPFPPSTNLYPPAHVAEEYLRSFTEEFRLGEYIKLRTRVERATWDADSGRWKVTYRAEGEDTQEDLFDLTIIANGHYHLPRYPSIPGLQAWHTQGKLTHSAWYRHPLPTDRGRKVLVVGGGASGNDIAAEVATEGGATVVHSLPRPKGTRKPPVTAFLDVQTGTVEFADGATESGIDRCILATGYEMEFPFLSDEIIRPHTEPSIPPPVSNIWNTTYSVFPLARHVFPLPNAGPYPPHTLAFLGLPIKVAPFPIVEAQAAYVAYIFAHPHLFDSDRESELVGMRVEALKKRFAGDEGEVMHRWHVFEGLEPFEYTDELYRLSGRPDKRTEDWEKELFAVRGKAREFWHSLVAEGKEGEWVEGVAEEESKKGDWEGARRVWGEVIARLVREMGRVGIEQEVEAEVEAKLGSAVAG
ncbi:monooxygenase [Marasmius crinis-equi]|uniref:Monooxygenase n=1 Tax=Marasmius crinis-equi TaxID=585013 RepID=A0ABR3EYX0_9AGAR